MDEEGIFWDSPSRPVEAKFRAAENLRRLPAGPLARKDTDREERRFKFAIG